MAVVNFTKEERGNAISIRWEGLTTNDTGVPWERSDFQDKTVQIYGDFGSGATVTLQGSNDPRANPNDADHASAVWFSLTDPQANAIAKTAAAGEQILENPRWIRPSVTGGTSPDLDIAIEAIRGF